MSLITWCTARSAPSQSNSAYQPIFAYTGQLWDAAAGLYYDHARWYDAGDGRFISQDPTGFAAGDANLYRYAGNDPTNATDPTGTTDVGIRGGGMMGDGGVGGMGSGMVDERGGVTPSGPSAEPGGGWSFAADRGGAGGFGSGQGGLSGLGDELRGASAMSLGGDSGSGLASMRGGLFGLGQSDFSGLADELRGASPSSLGGGELSGGLVDMRGGLSSMGQGDLLGIG